MMRPQPIKSKLFVLIGLLIVVLAAMWMLGRCSRSNEETIVNHFARPGGDTLVVAIEMSPTSYAFSGDSAVGFDYEMLRDIAAQHNLPIVFHPFAPLDYALKGLEKGDFDMVVASVPASEKLRDDFLLTDDVFIDRQVLVRRIDTLAKDDSEIPPQIRMLGDTVWIPASSPVRQRLDNMSQELGDTIYIMSDPEYSAEHLVLLTALGEIKQAVINESVAKRLAADYPDIDISIPVSMSQFQPWILSENHQELRDSLNTWIRQYKESADYDRLSAKYLK